MLVPKFTLLALPLIVPAVAAAQFVETDDAPSSPLAPLAVVGQGPLTSISGATFTIPDDPVDSYRIRIDDPANFSASTDGLYDSVLFLFDIAGNPVLANDDFGGGSLITNPDIFPGMVNSSAQGVNLVAGEYVLSVAGFGESADNANGDDLFNIFLNNTQLIGPSPGVGGSFAGFGSDGFASPNTGNYTVTLEGVSFVPEPASVCLLGTTGLLLMRRRRHQPSP